MISAVILVGVIVWVFHKYPRTPNIIIIEEGQEDQKAETDAIKHNTTEIKRIKKVIGERAK
jgi:hypothetical protein